MDVTPIARTAVSEEVYTRLVNEVLTGGLPAGAALPSERDLSAGFGVNRHAVREALKRLQQSGLIRISHGGKTKVLDWRETVGLESLSALVAAGVVPPRRVMHDIAVMRRTVGSDAARMCATEGSEEQIARVSAAAAGYSAQSDREFWTAVIDGSDNLAYRLALNTLVAAIEDIGVQAIQGLAPAEFTDPEAHRELAARIVARDGDGAHRVADRLLGHLVAALRDTDTDTDPTDRNQTCST